MKRDRKLSLALHILTHLAAEPERLLTSEELAVCLRTNPVVIRRALAGLREGGIVTSMKGHGGGWTLARLPAAISLGEVYLALGVPTLLAPAPEVNGCLIQTIVDEALDGFYTEAETLLRNRLDGISLAFLSTDFQKRLAGRPASSHLTGSATQTGARLDYRFDRHAIKEMS